jgi:hypothetical protein
MKDLFPGFYGRTKEEFSLLWQEGNFIFDANMLLNVYRYQEETRKRFFEILEKLIERIWVPNQAIYEYQNNRLEIISHQPKVFGDVSTALKEAEKTLKGLEYLKEKHSFIKIDEIIDTPIKELSQANKKLSEGRDISKQEGEKLKSSDTYRDKLAQLFQDKIGTAYSREDLQKIYVQADKRLELNIPPGYKDKGKKTYGKYGDIILWFQLIDRARLDKKPVIFVTDDVKSDWFLQPQENNPHHRPRPELVQEMFVEAGVLLHIYPGYEFIDQATKFLKLKPEASVSEDAKEVTKRNALEEESLVERLIKESKTPKEIEEALKPLAIQAVSGWISKHKKNITYVLNFPDRIFPSIMITGINGDKTGIEIKVEFDFRGIIRELEYLVSYFNHKYRIDFENFALFIVYINESNAIQAADLIKVTKPSFPKSITKNMSIVIGYFVEDTFTFIDSFPSDFLDT